MGVLLCGCTNVEIGNFRELHARNFARFGKRCTWYSHTFHFPNLGTRGEVIDRQNYAVFACIYQPILEAWHLLVT